MMADPYPVPVEIVQLAERLRAARTSRTERPQSVPAFDHPLHTLDVDALWRRMGGEDVPIEDSGEDAEPIEPITRRKRRPTLASVAKQAAKAGVDVAAYDVRPDGTVRVIIGKPGAVSVDLDDTTIPDRSEWN